MLMITTTSLPDGMVLKDVYPLVFCMTPIQVSGKRVVQTVKEFFVDPGNPYEQAFENLQSQAPQEANAIIGIQMSTCSITVGREVIMQISLIGTPAVVGRAEDEGAGQGNASASGPV